MLHVTYKGKKKEDLDHPIEKAIVQRTEEYFEDILEPLADKINSDSDVLIDLTEDLVHIAVFTSNPNDELKARIIEEVNEDGKYEVY